MPRPPTPTYVALYAPSGRISWRIAKRHAAKIRAEHFARFAMPHPAGRGPFLDRFGDRFWSSWLGKVIRMRKVIELAKIFMYLEIATSVLIESGIVLGNGGNRFLTDYSAGHVF